MTDHKTPSFQVGERVIWWKQIPGGGYAYLAVATVLKVTAKRVQIEAGIWNPLLEIL